MIAEVIPAKRGKLRLATFDYLVPPELEAVIAIGQLVTIPLRNTLDFGIVSGLKSASTIAKIKPLSSIVFHSPFIPEGQLNFLKELGELYHTSLGFLVKNNLPPLQKTKLKKIKDQEIDSNVKPTLKKPVDHDYQTMAEKWKTLLPLLQGHKQKLFLVPELRDIKAVVDALPSEFREKTIIISSETSPKDLFTAWFDLWLGNKTIVVGTRRALFLPWANLDTIILDNEGNENYKSWDMAPRFHTRDAALMLAKHTGATLHLTSGTLSVETYYFTKHKVYDATTPLTTLLPSPFLINMTEERRGGNTALFGLDVIEQLQNSTGSAFFYCHHRGTFNTLFCRDCEKTVSCPACQHHLSYYRKKGLMVCNYCGKTQSPVMNCPSCGSIQLAELGAGTDAVAKAIKELLPNDQRPIIVVSSDDEQTIPDKNCIIVGTDQALRCVPWEKLSLFCAVDADTPLFVPEFRILEKSWLFLRDVAFRLPKDIPLFIQTKRPEHALYASLVNPETFYTNELKERKTFDYPPYRYLVRLFISSPNEREITTEAGALYHSLTQLTKGLEGCTISQDLPLFPYGIRGEFGRVIMIKLAYKNYKQSLKKILAHVPETWKVDPNPITLLSL